MGKEKFVYILNPDGLTESIFVAKGEPNEGQYRGKRFTKSGWKAEKRRLKDELMHQSLEQAAVSNPLNSFEEKLDSKAGEAKTWEEYSQHTNTITITVLEEDEENAYMEPAELQGLLKVDDAVLINETLIKPDLNSLMEELEDVEGEELESGITDGVKIESANMVYSPTKIYIVGSTKGVVFILNEATLEPISFHDYPAGFISRQEIINHLIILGAQYPKVSFIEKNGDSFFTATAEYSE